MTTHTPVNEVAAPSHVCPDIRIDAIDRVQPPGMIMLADMDRHE
jgi:hypothetical protein